MQHGFANGFFVTYCKHKCNSIIKYTTTPNPQLLLTHQLYIFHLVEFCFPQQWIACLLVFARETNVYDVRVKVVQMWRSYVMSTSTGGRDALVWVAGVTTGQVQVADKFYGLDLNRALPVSDLLHFKARRGTILHGTLHELYHVRWFTFRPPTWLLGATRCCSALPAWPLAIPRLDLLQGLTLQSKNLGGLLFVFHDQAGLRMKRDLKLLRNCFLIFVI